MSIASMFVYYQLNLSFNLMSLSSSLLTIFHNYIACNIELLRLLPIGKTFVNYKARLDDKAWLISHTETAAPCLVDHISEEQIPDDGFEPAYILAGNFLIKYEKIMRKA